MINDIYINKLIDKSLEEDINYIDIATDLIIPEYSKSSAILMAKQDFILCGIDIFTKLFKRFDNRINIITDKKDGDEIYNKEIICQIEGPTRSILTCERTALNILQHLSGISTNTNKIVNLIKETDTTITDTRKTIPGIRMFQKYAVMIGGGKNHRYNLSDMAMIKENHIISAGGIKNAVETLRKKISHTTKIEIEVTNIKELYLALQSKVDIIMLDNMEIQTMKDAIKINNKKCILEASGNITEENILEIASIGIDVISMGCLTHSVKASDVSLIVTMNEN
ncbi:MAG: carboxylating nicotinate-nucleotide diphosphorylase [Oscillospiraceae bacterium]|nr:carboxylating nicotinate-nucleotide diphosphorylase [Oscillospiraceae bacterium]